MLILILLAFFTNSNGQIISSGSCSRVKVQSNFELDKYAGKWYEIYRYENSNEITGECTYVKYTTDDDAITMWNYIIINKSLRGSLAFGDYEHNDSGDAKLNVIYATNYTAMVKYWILSTDYDNYALVYSCSNLQNENKQVYSWILSRTKDLPQSSRDELAPVIEASELKWQNYRRTNHQDDLCKYDE